MKTDTAQGIPFWSEDEVAAALRPALEQIELRRVLAYPTETVYGFGGGIDRDSVAALIRLKGRPKGKPFLLLIAGSDMLAKLDLSLPSFATNLAARFWPGPLTLVLPGGEKRVPEALRGPEGGIAVRWTPHKALQRLIRAHGDAITSTSANRPGVPPAASAREIREQWSDAIARGALRVLDGGSLPHSSPSTVLDCTARAPRVIRPGAIPAAMLREFAPTLIGDV
jgi:L-threonylcarbamoyladenylate synthase